jgi:Short C-terminal domain
MARGDDSPRLAIEYWYVSLGVAAILIVVALMKAARQRELARHRPGPLDPWINEVVVALADLGFTEIARNTGSQIEGVPLEGDVGLNADRLTVYVNLFSDQRRARQAELALRAKPKVRNAISSGGTAIETRGRVVYMANGGGGVVDEFRFDEVMRVAAQVPVPPPLPGAGTLQTAPVQPAALHATAARAVAAEAPSADVLEHLRRLGELRSAGVLTDAEFEAKKAELLGRI